MSGQCGSSGSVGGRRAIAAFGAAAAAAQRHFAAEAGTRWRCATDWVPGLKAISPHAVIFGEAAGRPPNTTLFAVEGIKAETAVIAFDLEGIAVSSGPACYSGKVQPSHVLAAVEISPALVRARCA